MPDPIIRVAAVDRFSTVAPGQPRPRDGEIMIAAPGNVANPVPGPPNPFLSATSMAPSVRFDDGVPPSFRTTAGSSAPTRDDVLGNLTQPQPVSVTDRREAFFAAIPPAPDAPTSVADVYRNAGQLEPE